MAEEQPLLGVDAQLVDRHDVGMFELAGDLRLFDEAGLLAGRRRLVEQVLDGDLAADVAIDGTQDRAHAAAGDLPFHRVTAAMAGVSGQQISHGPLLAMRIGGQVNRDVRRRAPSAAGAGRTVDLAGGMAARRAQARGTVSGCLQVGQGRRGPRIRPSLETSSHNVDRSVESSRPHGHPQSVKGAGVALDGAIITRRTVWGEHAECPASFQGNRLCRKRFDSRHWSRQVLWPRKRRASTSCKLVSAIKVRE